MEQHIFALYKKAYRGQLWKGKQIKLNHGILKIVHRLNLRKCLKSTFCSLKQKIFL
jgi:hypothetical protein